jgi:hypothetical protein
METPITPFPVVPLPYSVLMTAKITVKNLCPLKIAKSILS